MSASGLSVKAGYFLFCRLQNYPAPELPVPALITLLQCWNR